QTDQRGYEQERISRLFDTEQREIHVGQPEPRRREPCLPSRARYAKREEHGNDSEGQDRNGYESRKLLEIDQPGGHVPERILAHIQSGRTLGPPPQHDERPGGEWQREDPNHAQRSTVEEEISLSFHQAPGQ